MPADKNYGFPDVSNRKGVKYKTVKQLREATSKEIGKIKDPIIRREAGKLARYYGGMKVTKESVNPKTGLITSRKERSRIGDKKVLRRYWPNADHEGKVNYASGRGSEVTAHADTRAPTIKVGREMRKEYKKAIRQDTVAKYVKKGRKAGPGVTGRALRARSKATAKRHLEVSRNTYPDTVFKGKPGVKPLSSQQNIKATAEARKPLRQQRTKIELGARKSVALQKASVPVPKKSTLLDAIQAAGGNEGKVKSQLRSGELKLSGNFKGQEKEVAGSAPKKMAVKRKRIGKVPKGPTTYKGSKMKAKAAEVKTRPFKSKPVGGGFSGKAPKAPKAPAHAARVAGPGSKVRFKSSDGDFSKAARQSKNFGYSMDQPYKEYQSSPAFRKYGKSLKSRPHWKVLKSKTLASKKGKTLASKFSKAAPVISKAAKFAGVAGMVATLPSQAKGYSKAIGQIKKGKTKKGIATALQTFTGTRGMSEKGPSKYVKQPR